MLGMRNLNTTEKIKMTYLPKYTSNKDIEKKQLLPWGQSGCGPGFTCVNTPLSLALNKTPGETLHFGHKKAAQSDIFTQV